MAMRFANFDAEEFLRESWQKKPQLIRDPWQSWNNPLEPDELAGLACEPEVESRLITCRADALDLELGPLPETRFSRLGASIWTLLVQAVDHHAPAVAELIEPFRFIPNWRIDDVMVSYAVRGGGVGAHFDQYDVFLVQGLGTRLWQVGGRCDTETPLLPHDQLRLLADFRPTDEWLLEPGDILYVPPRFAHNGVAASDECMTYSVGFRAPSRDALMAGWTERLLDEIDDGERYTDEALDARANPGEITTAALARLHALATDRLGDRRAFARWFGQHTTAPKNPEIDWRPEFPLDADEIVAALRNGRPLIRNPASRFAFIREGSQLLLFVGGQKFTCEGVAAAFAEALCASPQLVASTTQAGSLEVQELIAALIEEGSLAFPEGDDPD